MIEAIDPGQFTEYIEIYDHTITENDYNEKVRSRETDPFATFWAKRVEFKSDEKEVASQMVGRDEIAFQMYYQSGISYTMELKYGGEYYNIVSVQPLGLNQYMEIIAKIMDNG
jgi:SPP1 family predicted phage head-tail adaptor